MSHDLTKGTHAFRRTVGTDLLNNSNGNIELVADILGNSPDVIRKNYKIKKTATPYQLRDYSDYTRAIDGARCPVDTCSAPTVVERRRSNFEPRMGLFQQKRTSFPDVLFLLNRSDRRRKVSGGHLLCADRSGTETLELFVALSIPTNT